MRDSRHDGQSGRSGDGLSVLARKIVARLATHDGSATGVEQRKVDDAIVASIARAVVSADRADFQSLKPDLRRARISEVDLVDSYFPAVARFLGCAWAEDRSPFTDVSIGVSRMQAIVRLMGRDWTSNTSARPDSATVLLVLPEGEQHSFGVVTLAGQLRRRGISVRLEFGATPGMLNALVQRQSFDLAMISVGCEERLAPSHKLVRAIKSGSRGGLRVAVGGAVLERPVDVQGSTGADIVTNDPMEALGDACLVPVQPTAGTT